MPKMPYQRMPERPERTCEWCFRTFRPKKMGQAVVRHCSRECQVKHLRHRQKLGVTP
jgi:hypothetical protein